jgi:hypothetical protein
MASFGIGNISWQQRMPEYELEGYWTCDIIDDPDGMEDIRGNKHNNSIKVSNYMPLGFDSYVQNVSIPQLSLNYEVNNLGFMKFKEKSAYDDVTMGFYDDLEGSCLGFFTDWLHTIYDESSGNQIVKPNWRYETKTIEVKYYRLINDTVKTIAHYKMVKCLPKGVSEISADEDSGDRKTFSVTLATQRVYTYTNKTNLTENAEKLVSVV